MQNLAEFRVAGLFNGYLNVAGTVAPVQHENKEAIRVDVKFTAFGLKLGVLPELRIPLSWPQSPTVRTLAHHPALAAAAFFL